VQASVGGKLAQIGSRLVDGAAAKMADEFFAAFSKQFIQQQSGYKESIDAESTDGSSANSAVAGDPHTPAPRAQDGTGFIWITAFVVLITAMVLAL